MFSLSNRNNLRYYAFASLIEPKIPINETQVRVPVTWHDSVRRGKKCSECCNTSDSNSNNTKHHLFPFCVPRNKVQLIFSFILFLVAASHNLFLDLAGMLFNYAALASQIGAASDRSTLEGLKLSCKYFQVRPPFFLP
jgi:hypothetical protein